MKKYILILALMATVGSVAQAATIYLKDGSVIKGTIVSATAQDIQVNSEDGLLKIKSERILRINYADDSAQTPAPQTQQQTPPVTSEQAPPEPPQATEPPSQSYPPPARYVRRRRYVQREPVAQEPENTNQIFSLNFGFSSPLSRIDFDSDGDGSDSNGETGVLLGTQYLYQATSRLAWGLNLEYMNRSASDSGSILNDIDTRVSGDSLVLMPVLKYSFTDRGWARPYVLAGVGTNRTSTFIDARPAPDFAWINPGQPDSFETRTLVNDSRWGLATTARLGIDFMQFSPSFFGLEIGWTGISNGSYSTTQAGKNLGLNSVTGNLSLLNISGRWGWKF